MKRTTIIYGNCRVYAPNDALIFLCTEKRINWYIDRKLATIISNNPLSIRLNFEPKGISFQDDYHLQPKENQCVVCGERDISKLTQHHVVPKEYRKHFPEVIKSRSCHDLVPICQKHHFLYENKFAQELKAEIELTYKIERPKQFKIKREVSRAYNFAKILIDVDKCSKIPKERVKEMLQLIDDVFGTDDIFEIAKYDFNEKIRNEEYKVGKLVVEQLKDLDEFMKMWRQHFLDSMNPKFMPANWSVNYKNIKSENDIKNLIK